MDSLSSMANSLPSYYVPLPDNHIRLLELDRGGTEAVHCKLLVVDLATEPLYHALSYTWGNPRPEIHQEDGYNDITHTIFINGYSKRIGTNLHNILLRLRSACPATTVPIWIDALCINQDDAVEKSAQVERMDEIYKRASLVFAWLGEADDYSAAGFAVVEKLAKLDEQGDANCEAVRAMELTAYGLDDWYWVSLIAVLRRAWFSRVWVIQEIYFAQRLVVICGQYMLCGNVFGHATHYLMASRLWQKLILPRMMFTAEKDRHAGGPGIQAPGASFWALQQVRLPLEDRMRNERIMSTLGRGSKASDLRDCVYALRGLVKQALDVDGERSRALPRVSYDKGVTAADAFIEWAKFITHEVENFALFSLVEDRSHRAITALPSWVPDMSVSIIPVTLRAVDRSWDWKPFGSNTGGWILYTEDPKVIKVPAARFDKIVAISTDLSSMKGSQGYVSLLELIEPLAATTGRIRSLFRTATAPPYANPLAALAKTLIADSIAPTEQDQDLAINLIWWLTWQIETIKGDRKAIYPPILRMASKNRLVQEAFSRVPAEVQNNGPERTQQIQAFEVRSKTFRGCRRLVRTQEGYIGLAPLSTQVGDEVFVLPNSITPFVMRKRADGMYELVGEAYLHGVMSGEVTDTLRWEEILIS